MIHVIFTFYKDKIRNVMHNLSILLTLSNSSSVFCYVPRHNSENCNAKEGNPFGPFWDTFEIDFVGSEFYRGLTYDVHHQNMAEKWTELYPGSKWPGEKVG